MASNRKNLASFPIIIGVLTLILTACAFAEKAHEDHLPERNRQGNAETNVYTGVSDRDAYPAFCHFEFCQQPEPNP